MPDPRNNAHDASTEAPAPRRVVRSLGRYQLAKLLGEGAMGRVYLATDPDLGRDVAIKVLRLDQAGSARDAYIARFRNEARAAARFNHPNVVSVHDAGVDSNLGPYLVYEFIPGLTLRATLDKGRLDSTNLLRVARGVAAALDALHGARIVHRDVKPDNILLAPDGRVKLTDFGIARVPDMALTRDGQFLGTPAYAAPEAIAKGEYSHRGDLFSLAAVLYEALAGVRPFPGDDAVTVSYAVVNDTPKLLSTVAPGVPVAVDDVFIRALAKQPEDRFATARDLYDALAAALQIPRPQQAARSTQPPIPMRTQTPRTVTRPAPVAAVKPRSVMPMVFAAMVLAGVVVAGARHFSSATPGPAVAQAPTESTPPGAGTEAALAATPTTAAQPADGRPQLQRARVRRSALPAVTTRVLRR